MKAAAALALMLATAGCSYGDDGGATPAAQNLESAAIARGIIRDPASIDPVGLYHRDTDRVCVVRQGEAYRIGAFVDYGDGLTCSAVGQAMQNGEVLRIVFGGHCAFDARYDGDRIAFPGELPSGCAAFCHGRAALSGLAVVRLSGAVAEARALRDTGGRLLCATDG